MAFTIPVIRPAATVKPFEVPDATEQLRNILAARLAQERINALRTRTAPAQQKAAGQSEGQIYDPATGQYRSTTVQGKYKNEREASLGAQQDELLKQLIANNEALKKLQSVDFENMDVQRKDKAVQEAALQAEKLLRPDAPDAVKTRFSDMVNAYLDPYRSRVSQEYKTVEEDDDWEYFRDNFKLGIMRGKDALASFFLNESPEELKQRNDAYNAYEQELREKNAYMMDQYRRAQHGEDFWDQMTGDSGNIANNLLGAALRSPLEIGIPAVVAALTAPVSAPIAAAAGAATGILASAPAGGWEYQRSILNDNTLTPEEQAHAIEEGTNTARVISGAAGMLPGAIGNGVSILRGAATRPATKAVLDAQFKAAATKAAAEAGEAAPQFADDFLSTARRVAAQQDANAGRWSRAAQGVTAAGVEGFLSGGGEQIAQNVATRVGTGRDIGVMDNVLENALVEAVVGAPLGTAAALRRVNKLATSSTTSPAPTDSGSDAGDTSGTPAPEAAGPSIKFNREFRAKVNQDLAEGKPFDAAAIKREYLSNGYTEKDWATFVGNNDKIVADKRFAPEIQQQLLHTVEAAPAPSANTQAVAAEANPFRLLPSSTDLNTVLTEDKVGRAQSLISSLRKTKSGDTDKVVKEMRRFMAEENLTPEDISAIATVARLGKKVESTGAVAKVRAKNPAPISKAASANVISAFEVLNNEEIAKRKELAANVNAVRAMANELGEANGQQGPAPVEPNVAGAATGSSQRAAGSSGGMETALAAATANSPNGNVTGIAAGNTQAQGGGVGRSAEQNNGAAVPAAGTPQGAQSAAAESGAERGPSAGDAAQADAGPSEGAGTPTVTGVGPTAGAGNEADAGSTVDAGRGTEQRTVDPLYFDTRNPVVRGRARLLEQAGRTPEQAEREAEIEYRLASAMSDVTGLTPEQHLQRIRYGDVTDAEQVRLSLQQLTEIADVRAKYENTPVWLKAPNGNTTNLTEQQWLLVRTPSFKQWFGDWENDPDNASKIIDENGEPLVVYHGASRGGYVIFDTAGRGRAINTGAWFTSDIGKAATYSGNKALVRAAHSALELDTPPQIETGAGVYAVFLNMRTPAKYDAAGKNWNNLGKVKTNTQSYAKHVTTNDLVRSIRADAQRNADGVIIENVVDNGPRGVHLHPSNNYVVFDPTQIKSATDNAGTFYPDEPNILLQSNERGRIEFLDAGTANILFGKNADASTAIHEYEHWFVDFALQTLADPTIPDSRVKEQLAADMTTLAKFVGVDPARATDFNAWTTKAHEKAARAFEKYFREGKAPVSELQGLFSKMKELLTQIYRRAKDLLSDKLTPEVRAVFDRQLTGYGTRTDLSRMAVAEDTSPSVIGETPVPDAAYWDTTAQDSDLDIDPVDRLNNAYPFLKTEGIC